MESRWLDQSSYKEDCQWSIAAVVHPIGFTRTIKIEGKPDRTEMEIAHETLRNWFPDWFETFCGVQIEPGQSIVRDQQIFDRNNRSNYVVTAAWGDWAHWVPEGKVGVIAKRNSDHTEKWFLVDKALYGQKFVIDLTRDTEITKPERP